MRMMNKTELKSKLSKAMDESVKICDSFKGSLNPQQRRVFNHNAGKVEAFNDVLQTLNGNPIHLNISAGE